MISTFPLIVKLFVNKNNFVGESMTSIFSMHIHFFVFLVGALLIGSGCGDQNTQKIAPLMVACNSCKDAQEIDPAEAIITHVDDEISETKIGEWHYLTRKRSMISRKFYAICHSRFNTGGAFASVPMSIWIQKSVGRNEVMLSSTKTSDFLSSTAEKSLQIRFDGKPPVSFPFRLADDGSTNSIFIVDANRFIQRLKNAKKITIDAPCNEAEPQLASFLVKGLIWEHL